jgi:hypothetical protein
VSFNPGGHCLKQQVAVPLSILPLNGIVELLLGACPQPFRLPLHCKQSVFDQFKLVEESQEQKYGTKTKSRFKQKGQFDELCKILCKPDFLLAKSHQQLGQITTKGHAFKTHLDKIPFLSPHMFLTNMQQFHRQIKSYSKTVHYLSRQMNFKNI